MAFWENLGETISAKGKEVADKAKNITDIAGLKGQIATCENTIKKNYKDIGEAYYKAHKEDEQPEFAEQIEAIKMAETAIEELKQKISHLKGTKTCAKCGAEVPYDASFCPKCGEKMEEDFYDEDDSASELTADIIDEEDIVD